MIGELISRHNERETRKTAELADLRQRVVDRSCDHHLTPFQAVICHNLIGALDSFVEFVGGL